MKKLHYYSVLVLLCIGLTGCNTTDKITRAVAEETALGEVDGEVSKYTERFDDAEPHHLFDIVKNDQHYEVKVHHVTGKVISSKLIDDNEGVQPTNATDSFISEKEAKEIALKKVGGGTVVKTEFSTEDGIKVYKIEIQHNNKEYEVEINAISKEIIEFEEHVID